MGHLLRAGWLNASCGGNGHLGGVGETGPGNGPVLGRSLTVAGKLIDL